MTEDEFLKIGIVGETEWERTSDSWKALRPKKNFNEIDLSDESVAEYCARVADIIKIPHEVAEQWLYNLYSCGNTIDNYGWIDFRNAEFESTTLKSADVLRLRVIETFQSYVEEAKFYTNIESLPCIPKDKECWDEFGTWRTPPIVIDVGSFPKPPKYSDMRGVLQLVEGHSRLGYFKTLIKNGVSMSREHKIYLLRGIK